jgi:hypothetical protein
MKRLYTSVLVVALAGAATAAATSWRISAQKPLPPGTAPVETMPSRQRPGPADRTDRGATYYWLEGQAARTSTTFVDATVISERGADGDVSTRVTDLQGNELARLHVDRVGSADSVLVFQPATGDVLRANARAGLRTPLDWGNEQAYSLWKDGTGASGKRLVWQEDFMRPAGMPRRDLKKAITEMRTDWNGGLSARAIRKPGPHTNLITGAVSNSDALLTVFTRDDLIVGTTIYYPDDKLFVWRFPGLTEGSVDPSQLEEVGGWQFTPDMAWTNVQSFAFHQFHTRVVEQNQAARADPGWLGKLAGLVVPTLSADAGCDGLHWLDSSIFRPCCDSHDYCYEKRGCSSRSWWQFWSSWQCDGCNLMVVSCFSSGGRGPFYQYPYPYWYQ